MPFCIQGDVGLYTIEHTLTHTHTHKSMECLENLNWVPMAINTHILTYKLATQHSKMGHSFYQ
jgi:hypothetical protein